MLKRTLAILVGAAMVLPGVAAADCPRDSAATRPIVSRLVRGPDGTRIVIDTPIDVCVRIPGPAVAYVAPSPSPQYEWMALERDFLPLILASVRAAAFGGEPAPRPEDPS